MSEKIEVESEVCPLKEGVAVTSGDELEQARAEVRHLKEDLLACTHQFNNLFVGIEGGARLLLDGNFVSKDGEHLLVRILDAVRRAALFSESIQRRHADITVFHEQKDEEKKDHEAAQGAGTTILVIDDEEIVRSMSRDILVGAGFRVLLAESGQEGLALYEMYGKEIDAVLLDLTMPYMSGNLVYARLKALDPDVQAVVMSGYCDAGVIERFEGVTSFLPKPFSPEEVVDVMVEAAQVAGKCAV
jgi:CheY-like chemotaxis protein